MKRALILPLVVFLGGCAHKNMPVSDFCNVMNRTAYNNGKFTFNPTEIAAMQRENKEKIVALKRTYKEICLQ